MLPRRKSRSFHPRPKSPRSRSSKVLKRSSPGNARTSRRAVAARHSPKRPTYKGPSGSSTEALDFGELGDDPDEGLEGEDVFKVVAEAGVLAALTTLYKPHCISIHDFATTHNICPNEMGKFKKLMDKHRTEVTTEDMLEIEGLIQVIKKGVYDAWAPWKIFVST